MNKPQPVRRWSRPLSRSISERDDVDATAFAGLQIHIAEWQAQLAAKARQWIDPYDARATRPLRKKWKKM
jgi:hypothetical protein